jgi:hypothetical protein
MLANNPSANMQIERRLQNLPVGRVDVSRLFTERERSDKTALIAALEKRLLQDKLKPKQEQAVREFLDSQSALDNDAILNAIRLVMSTPEYQLT